MEKLSDTDGAAFAGLAKLSLDTVLEAIDSGDAAEAIRALCDAAEHVRSALSDFRAHAKQGMRYFG